MSIIDLMPKLEQSSFQMLFFVLSDGGSGGGGGGGGGGSGGSKSLVIYLHDLVVQQFMCPFETVENFPPSRILFRKKLSL